MNVFTTVNAKFESPGRLTRTPVHVHLESLLYGLANPRACYQYRSRGYTKYLLAILDSLCAQLDTVDYLTLQDEAQKVENIHQSVNFTTYTHVEDPGTISAKGNT